MVKVNENIIRLENRKFERNFLRGFAISLILLGSIVFIIFLFKSDNTHHIAVQGEAPNFPDSGQFGDFIGGVVGTIFSLAGVILLIWTLREQRENFHRERLESNFFELIKFHRENVNELSYSYFEKWISADLKDERIEFKFEKRAVFKAIYDQFSEACEELSYLFDNKQPSDIYIEKYLNEIRLNDTLIEREIDLVIYAKIDIIYLIVFFGVGDEGRNTITNILKETYQIDFLDDILNMASMKPLKESMYWVKWETIIENLNNDEIFRKVLNKRLTKEPTDDNNFSWHISNPHPLTPTLFNPFYPDSYIKYYGGHQFRLGHYYRHFFQSIKYIDKEQSLSYKVKYSYIKMFRGQLSTYEQIIFFLNSLSTIGRAWELEKKNKPSKAIEINNQLITKYNLIKNIPNNALMSGLKVSDYYPSLKYEAFYDKDKRIKRKDLEEQYF